MNWYELEIWMEWLELDGSELEKLELLKIKLTEIWKSNEKIKDGVEIWIGDLNRVIWIGEIGMNGKFGNGETEMEGLCDNDLF